MPTTELNHETLTDAFFEATQAVFKDYRKIAIFTVAPALSDDPDKLTRLSFGHEIAKSFSSILPMNAVDEMQFLARVKSHVIHSAEKKTFGDSGFTLFELFTYDAPAHAQKQAFHELMTDISENAAHTAIMLLKGKNKAANENTPRPSSF